jgi:UDP-N-acetylmuramoylalanine--D-glutamate ligase
VLAGNMRISALAQLAQITPTTPVVLELSSFVLEGLDCARLSPAVAAITNIHPDHLDRYGEMATYIAAKAAIGLHQSPSDVLILGTGNAPLCALAAIMPGHVHWAGGVPWGQPLRVGDVCWVEDRLHLMTHTGVCVVADRQDIQLRGAHNDANVAVAVAVAVAAGMPSNLIAPALRTFTGVEHRQEGVASIAGHWFVNDTAATMPEAAMAALACMPGPIIWIAGGADKKLTFDALAEQAARYAERIVLLDGSATPALYAACERAGIRQRIVGVFADFEAAVRAAHAVDLRPATVLLSPGCASFGMFRNEFHRGEEFCRIVQALAIEEPS